MRFESSSMLFLLLVILVMIIFSFWRKKQYDKAYGKLADQAFFGIYLSPIFHSILKIKNILFLSVVFFLILALARPQWNEESGVAEKKGLDIVFCIDVSKSMDAEDIKPTRLDRAKSQINMFLDNLKSDRAGIVAFAGSSVVQCPMTDDYPAVKLFVDQLDTNSIPNFGTNIGEALDLANSMFTSSSKKRIIVLLSDGEDLDENAISVSKKIASSNLSVYTIGIGSPEGSVIQRTDENGNKSYLKDQDGNIIVTKLSATTLRAISTNCNGIFFNVTPRNSEIFEILKQISFLERNKYKTTYYAKYKDQYQVFCILILILLLIDTLIYPKHYEIKRNG